MTDPKGPLAAYAPDGTRITAALFYVPGNVDVEVVMKDGTPTLSVIESEETDMKWDDQFHVTDKKMNITPDGGRWFVDANGSIWAENVITFSAPTGEQP